MTSTTLLAENSTVVCVAVPVPLRQTFDFLLPQGCGEVRPRTRVKVPFGKRTLVGVVLALKADSDYPLDKLKPVLEILDEAPLFDDALWETLQWLSRYYLAPIGEVFDLALPSVLRKGESISPSFERVWRLTDHGRISPLDDLNRAPLQLAIIKRFMRQSILSSLDFKQESGSWRSAVKTLVEKGWLEEQTRAPALSDSPEKKQRPAFDLTEEQTAAVGQLSALVKNSRFASVVLQGVTGSGKTEVYFAAMRAALETGHSVLLLVPEIGLTPQLMQRIEESFSDPLVTLHSGLNDTERHLAWWHAREGHARIVIGTRSAVFTPMPNLGLIVVDEEHDGSFKQQDGVRYQARDLAIYRAKQHNIPIILGSATPALETMANVKAQRYQRVRLRQRATNVALPKVELFDLGQQPVVDGLCPAMNEAIDHVLTCNKQVMLFLNRRGFAPVLYCVECKEAAKCHRCDCNLTVHQRANRLRCHHCGYEAPLSYDCRSCKSKESMHEVGDGTQRVEEALAKRFPDANVLRIDRDSTRRKGELEMRLEQARDGRADIILGTQLISKGHDFPNVGMVGILETDQGLYSTDFRATEVLFQQVLQVAGRAGRREDVGRVYIQTRFPEHPFFHFVKAHDFDGFAEQLLSERQEAGFPPFGYSALLRAESTHQAKALQFLRRARNDCGEHPDVLVMDAVTAPMERRQGRYRAQLLFLAKQRSSLNAMLSNWLNYISQNSEAKKIAATVRWSLDIDPLDHF